jgi:thioredoxin 1
VQPGEPFINAIQFERLLHGLIINAKGVNMSASIIEVSDYDFDTEVLANAKPSLVDFWAPWCGPCQAVAPVIEGLAADYDQQVMFAKLNVDSNPQVPFKYNIQSIPTLLFFKNGQVADKITGAVGRPQIEQVLKKII